MSTSANLTTATRATPGNQDASVLIRRVNQLYHELAHDRFDDVHWYRHRVERRFWNRVAQTTLTASNPSSRSERVVVDLACGTGFVSQTFLPHLRDSDRLIAVDLGLAPLKEARRKGEATVPQQAGTRPESILHSCVADAQKIPLADASADVIAINASLHHLPDPAEALEAVHRVLKPGGYFALGFEPNRTHFRSPLISTISASFNRACWYASPKENLRRIRKRFPSASHETSNANADDSDVLASVINQRLITDGLIAQPMSTASVLDLVDPHARGADDVAGFEPFTLLRSAMADYQAVYVSFSDYLGESARRWPWMRSMTDVLLRQLLPQHGSLFSWLIRKPISPKQGGNA